MQLRGQTPTFQMRLEISEHTAAGLNDTQIATVVGCSVWTVRRWRRRWQKLGRVGSTSRMGRPATCPVTYMQKDQIGVTRSGQGGFCSYPIDPCLLFGHLSCRISFGSIALAAFVLLQPSLRKQELRIDLFSHYGPLYRRWRMKSRKHRPSWSCPVGRPLTLH